MPTGTAEKAIIIRKKGFESEQGMPEGLMYILHLLCGVAVSLEDVTGQLTIGSRDGTQAWQKKNSISSL